MGAEDASQFIRKTASVGGLTIAYLQGGRGEPLGYLHGLPGWGKWERHHIALGITNMVYAVQLPGWQDGVIPGEIKSVRDYAKMIAALLDELDPNSIDPVGHSIPSAIPLADGLRCIWRLSIRRASRGCCRRIAEVNRQNRQSRENRKIAPRGLGQRSGRATSRWSGTSAFLTGPRVEIGCGGRWFGFTTRDGGRVE
jgi:hypothetical protein